VLLVIVLFAHACGACVRIGCVMCDHAHSQFYKKLLVPLRDHCAALEFVSFDDNPVRRTMFAHIRITNSI
jgi:hypothetical protein